MIMEIVYFCSRCLRLQIGEVQTACTTPRSEEKETVFEEGNGYG